MTPRWEAPSRLSTTQHLARLLEEGERVAEVASSATLATPVPGCPGWDVEALIRHLGDVHRWAAAIVRERLTKRPHRDSAGPLDREGLLAWSRQGHLELLTALRESSPAERYWTWAPAANPQSFWARRQAHETAIHRLDVEQAMGIVTGFPAPAAEDGIDEWLTLASGRVSVPDGGGRRLHLTATETGAEWQIELGVDGLLIRTDQPDGDLSVRASASDLFALVMNRRDTAGLETAGDADVLRAWRDSVRF